jgi:hypothetical protein
MQLLQTAASQTLQLVSEHGTHLLFFESSLQISQAPHLSQVTYSLGLHSFYAGDKHYYESCMAVVAMITNVKKVFSFMNLYSIIT